MVLGRRPGGRVVGGLPREAYRPSGIFLALVAVFVTAGVMAWLDFGSIRLNVFLFVVAGWVVSLCLHEYGHALLAYRAGDTGVAARGYLTLNPLKYAHPVLSLVLPLAFLLLGGIALPGGAVWVDRHAVRNRLTDSLISLVGPASNLLFALVLLVPFWVGVDPLAHGGFWAAVAFLAYLQLVATVLNLVPIPGTDGGNALQPWLSPQWQRYFDLFAPYGLLLLFALLFSPVVRGLFFGLVDGLADLLGLPLGLAAFGHDLFRWWSF